MEPTPEAVPECLACGTCCFSDLPEYIRVFGFDLDRMDDRARAFTVFDGHRCHMAVADGHCAALVIDPVARRFTCSIYEMRPDCCRVFTRGESGCRADRHEKGARPLLAVERLLRPQARVPGQG